MSALGVEQILTRLDDRFQLLTDRTGRLLERHRTLRAAVEWSHELLSESERVLFRRLSVFAGGWTPEAAEEVCADDLLPPNQVLDLLTRLVDRSLVLVEGQDTVARYRSLETLRQFGAERLAAASETESVRNRHYDWYVALAQRADSALSGPDQANWIAVLEREHDNARAALRWCVQSAAGERALALSTAYAYFWEIRGHRYRAEARHWIEEALALPAARVAPSLRGTALFWAGMFATEQFDTGRAETLMEEDRRLCEGSQDQPGLALALLGLGHLAFWRGDYLRAEDALSQSLSLSQASDDRRMTIWALRTLGTVARSRGDAPSALGRLTECLRLCRAIGDSHMAGHMLDGIGECERDLGHFDGAGDAHEQAVELLGAAGCDEGVNSSKYRQACLAHVQGDPSRALALAIESLRGFWVLGTGRRPLRVPERLEFVGAIIAGQQPGRAAKLFGAAQSLRESLHLPLPAVDRGDYDTALVEAHRALGKSGFEAAFAVGLGITTERAIELAAESTSVLEPTIQGSFVAVTRQVIQPPVFKQFSSGP